MIRSCARTLILVLVLDLTLAHHASAQGATQNAIALCSAGMSARTGITLGAIVARSGGSIDLGVTRQLVGTVLADTSIPADKRVDMYNTYVSCIEDIYPDQHSDPLPYDASKLVKTVVSSHNWRPASSLSDYDWVDDYNLRFQNQSPTKIACHYRIRGLLEANEASHNRDGEVNEYDFELGPGDTHKIEDNVGVYGNSDNDHLVTVSTKLSCWYKGLPQASSE